MRVQRLSLCAALVAAFAAAASADEKVTVGAPVELPGPDPARTVVVLLREEFARAIAMKPDNLMLDGQPLALLPQRTFLVAKVEPGLHCLSGVPETRDLKFQTLPGEVVLLRLRERIDDQDRVVADWLFDDATSARELIRTKKLKFASTTESGAEKLERIAQARPGDCDRPGTVDASAHPESAFVEVSVQDPVALKSTKSTRSHRTGRLVVNGDGLHYRDKERTIEVPIGKLRRVYFGGTQLNDPTPWVNVDWSGTDGAGVLSFADSRPAQATQTYDRLFRAVADLLARTSHPAEAETLHTAPRR